MKTYQDLLKADNKNTFCRDAVLELMASEDYRNARSGEAYYAGHNETMEHYVKKITTMSGKEVPDIFSANYKLKTQFFHRAVTQKVQYVLGNGVTVEHKEKLGKDFDMKMAEAGTHAKAAGKSFLFWNLDHMEVMSYVNTATSPGFCPLHDETNGIMMAGIRFYSKKIGNEVTWFYTLYEPDGYTEVMGKETEEPRIIKEKRGYKITKTTTEAYGVMNMEESNYSTLPIIPLYGNSSHESELTGIKSAIDCYDLIKSGFANEIDDTSGVYWLLTNTGAMEDPDIAQLWQRLKSTHGMVLEDDADVSLQTVNIPVEARQTFLEILKKDLYEDMQLLDVSVLSAAAKTTQEIQAAYQAQDNDAADFEYQILSALDRLLPLAGVTGNPTLQWQKVVNMTEQTNMVLSAANYLSDECIIRHLPFLTPEEIEEEIKNLNDREIVTYEEQINDETEDTAGEADNTNIRRS